VAALTSFPVQNFTQPVYDAADVARGLTQDWITRDCEDDALGQTCTVTFQSHDMRGPPGPVGPIGLPWELTATVWLPEGEGPHPMVLFAHGLDSSRFGVGPIKNWMREEGFAVAAVDAVFHGDHPTRAAEPGLAFLGVSFTPLGANLLQLRGAFEQTAIDRLIFTETLATFTDVDGDGQSDIDPDHMGYIGNSLGGLLAPMTLALQPRLRTAALTAPGAHLSQFVFENPALEPYQDLLTQLFGGADSMQQVAAVAQTGIDMTDPATWAAELARQGADGPHMLVYLSKNDQVVPPPAGKAMVRALELPEVGPEPWSVRPLPVVGDRTLQGNQFGLTRAFIAYDQVHWNGENVASNHDNLGQVDEVVEQIRHYFQTSLQGTPEWTLDP